jgi:hypothetical protein
VDQAQSAQGALAQWIVAQIRNDQSLFVTDNNVFNNTGTVDQDTDLAADIGREFYKAGAELMGTELGRRDTSPVEALQRLNVT